MSFLLFNGWDFFFIGFFILNKICIKTSVKSFINKYPNQSINRTLYYFVCMICPYERNVPWKNPATSKSQPLFLKKKKSQLSIIKKLKRHVILAHTWETWSIILGAQNARLTVDSQRHYSFHTEEGNRGIPFPPPTQE